MPIDELDRLATALGVDVVDLIAAAKQQRPGPDGAGPQVLPQLDSNQQPAGYTAWQWADQWGEAA